MYETVAAIVMKRQMNLPEHNRHAEERFYRDYGQPVPRWISRLAKWLSRDQAMKKGGPQTALCDDMLTPPEDAAPAGPHCHPRCGTARQAA
jgi:hypothetical protein